MSLLEQDFSSKTRYERIARKGSVGFVTPAASPYKVTVTINHNLGYIPYFRLFYSLQGFSGYFQSFNGLTLNLSDWNVDNLIVDTNTISLDIYSFPGSKSGSLSYRIYAEPK